MKDQKKDQKHEQSKKCQELIKKGDTFFKQHTGVSIALFQKLVEAYTRHRKTNILSRGGPRSSTLGLNDIRVLIYLERLRQYGSYQKLGANYEAHASTIMRICYQVHDALKQSKKFALPGFDSGDSSTAIQVLKTNSRKSAKSTKKPQTN